MSAVPSPRSLMSIGEVLAQLRTEFPDDSAAAVTMRGTMNAGKSSVTLTAAWPPKARSRPLPASRAGSTYG